MYNVENIKYSIGLMKNAKNLNLKSWQGLRSYELPPRRNIEELHSCGTSACFAGYIAASKKFKFDGGFMGFNGAPILDGKYGEYAIARWLGINVFDAKDISGLGDITESGENVFYGKQLKDITPEDVIEKLEELLVKHQLMVMNKKENPSTFEEFVQYCIDNKEGFKVRVNPETSRLVQETVFKCGGTWQGCIDLVTVSHENSGGLHLSEEGTLSRSLTSSGKTFNDDKAQEIVIEPTTALKLVEVIKPKSDKDIVREKREEKVKELLKELEELLVLN